MNDFPVVVDGLIVSLLFAVLPVPNGARKILYKMETMGKKIMRRIATTSKVPVALCGLLLEAGPYAKQNKIL